MKQIVTLNEADYITEALYKVSKSAEIKRKRRLSWGMTTWCFFIFGFLFYEAHNDFLTYYFVISGIVCLLFFPLYQRWYYKKHYVKTVKKTYENCFGKDLEIEFTEDYLQTSNFSGESKIFLSQLDYIDDINNYYFIKVKAGGSLIIPKNQIDTSFAKLIEEVALRFNIEIRKDLNWK